MSDKNLRKKLVKLAHDKPELRADLLPLITESKTASSLLVKCRSAVTIPREEEVDAEGQMKAGLEWATKYLTSLGAKGIKEREGRPGPRRDPFPGWVLTYSVPLEDFEDFRTRIVKSLDQNGEFVFKYLKGGGRAVLWGNSFHYPSGIISFDLTSG